jgi:hypothetical protein
MNKLPNISLQKENTLILKVVAVATILTALTGGYYFFVNNVWKPKIQVTNVDFANGFANLKLPFGKTIDIYGDSPFLIGGDWSVKFGTINKNGKTTYENIQLLKRGLVEEYIDTTNFK